MSVTGTVHELQNYSVSESTKRRTMPFKSTDKYNYVQRTVWCKTVPCRHTMTAPKALYQHVPAEALLRTLEHRTDAPSCLKHIHCSAAQFDNTQTKLYFHSQLTTCCADGHRPVQQCTYKLQYTRKVHLIANYSDTEHLQSAQCSQCLTTAPLNIISCRLRPATIKCQILPSIFNHNLPPDQKHPNFHSNNFKLTCTPMKLSTIPRSVLTLHSVVGATVTTYISVNSSCH